MVVSQLIKQRLVLFLSCRQDRDIESEDFQRYPVKVQASLQDCPVQRPPAALLSRHRNKTSSARQSQSEKVKMKVDLNQSWLFGGSILFHFTGIFFSQHDTHYTLLQVTRDEQVLSETSTESCYLSSSPRATRQAFRFGGVANSRRHYDLPDSLSERWVGPRTFPKQGQC